MGLCYLESAGERGCDMVTFRLWKDHPEEVGWIILRESPAVTMN